MESVYVSISLSACQNSDVVNVECEFSTRKAKTQKQILVMFTLWL